MAGISSDLLKRIDEALSDSGELGSNKQIQSVFRDNSIKLWRYQIPERDNVRARVTAITDFLSDKWRGDPAENGLVLLLRVLRDRFDPDETLYSDLEELAVELEIKLVQGRIRDDLHVHCGLMSDEQLRTVFADPKLRPIARDFEWKRVRTAATNANDVVDFLQDKQVGGGQNALVYMLRVAADKLQLRESCRERLREYADALEAALGTAPAQESPQDTERETRPTGGEVYPVISEPQADMVESGEHPGLTWLHLSDWHQGKKSFDRRVVLDALIKDIQNRREISPNLGQIDFIVFSGDVAFHGKAEEYEAAIEQFFNPVLEAADVDRNRLFIVPGNHDQEWDALELIPGDLLDRFSSKDEVHKWLTSTRRRRTLLSAMENYSEFVNDYLGEDLAGEEPAYGNVRHLEVEDKRVALIGLNSAWLSGHYKEKPGKVNDRGRLMLGEPQVYDAVGRAEDADVRIAVFHHPLDWLTQSDRHEVEGRLGRKCHFILNGHQHFSQIKLVKGTVGDCVVIPGGASYSRDEHEDSRYVNGYNFVHLNFAAGKGKIYLRRWSSQRTAWIANHDAYDEGKYSFVLPKNLGKPAQAPQRPLVDAQTIEDLLALLPEGELKDTVSQLEAGQAVDQDKLERIIGENTLKPIGWLEQGLQVAKSVCRIRTSDGGFGTGFLVAPNLLMTNHHVLPNQGIAASAEVQFNYQEDVNHNIQSYTYRLDANRFRTSETLDYTIVGVLTDPKMPSLERWGYVQLASDIPLNTGDHVSIIQHPGGSPKQFAFRDNKVVRTEQHFVFYTTDTSMGSSGSPVFNDAWQVVALHHSAGDSERDEKGRKRFVNNEGILISAIKADAGDALPKS